MANPLSVINGDQESKSHEDQRMFFATPEMSTCGHYCRRPDLLREHFLEGVLRRQIAPECPQFAGTNGKSSPNSSITENFQTPIEIEPVTINSFADCLRRSERIISAPSNLSVIVTTCCLLGCVHEIKLRAKTEHNMLLNITSFTVPGDEVLTEKSSNFCPAFLSVGIERETHSDSGFYQLASICDNVEPTVIFVPHREVLLRYHQMDKMVCEVDIALSLTIIPCQKHFVTHACQQMKHYRINENEGFIISPGFDRHIYYPNNITCTEKIVVPPDKLIKITMGALFLGDGDFLILVPKIYKNRHFPENITYTGYRRFQQPTILRSNECIATFLSDDVAPGFGFNLTYTAVNANDSISMNLGSLVNCSQSDSIPDSWKCDFQQKCNNGEDERNCSYRHDLCGAHGYYYKQHCYYVIENFDNSTWMEAEDFCESAYNAHLMSINTVGERKFIDKLWVSHDLEFSFLGLKRMKASNSPTHILYNRLWQWSDGKSGFYLPTEVRYESLQTCSMFTGVFSAASCVERYSKISLICETNSIADENDVDVDVPLNKYPSRQYDKNVFQNYTFECLSGEYIAQELVCNEWKDCFDGSDEVCENASGWETMFKCRINSNVPYTFVCNGINDCAYGDDEDFCRHPDSSSLPDGKAICRNGMVLDKKHWCDGRKDCIDSSDEDDCMVCSESAFFCPLHQCFPKLWKDDGEIDCPIQFLQGHDLLENRIKPHYVHSVEPPGIVHPDGYGKVSIEKLHKEDECPNTHFQCDEGFCIPIYLLCNTIADCPYGEDEERSVCKDQCKGMYKCKHVHILCIHTSQLCNNVYDCPHKDDEIMCTLNEISCPAGCACSRSEFFCTEIHNFNENIHISYLSVANDDIDLTNLDKIQSTSLIFLNISGNAVKEIGLSQLRFYNLLTLDASHNDIKLIHNDSFEHCSSLKTLLLAGNDIKGPQFVFLRKTRSLATLDLSNNINPELGANCFESIWKLHTLLLQNMGISRIDRDAFAGLTSLRELDLRGNKIAIFSDDIFRDQRNLFLVKTDNFRLCCKTVLPETFDEGRCVAPFEGVSSCTGLLRSTFLRAALWTMAALAISGNIGTIVYRIFFDYCQPIQIRIVMTCLAASDLLMGLYLMIIGGADAVFGHHFVTHEKEWKSSTACKVSGFIFLLSKEVSALFILVATLDRLLVIVFPLQNKFHFTIRSVSVVSVAVWLIGLSLALFPLLPSFKHWDLYCQISTGLPLPISTHRYPGFAYIYAVFIILNSFIFILISVGQISIYLSTTQQQTRVQTADSPIKQDWTVVKNLALMVVSCCLCWFAFTIMGILTAFGVIIPGDVDVFTTVILVPVNSALNPFLYAFNAACSKVKKKRTPS